MSMPNLEILDAPLVPEDESLDDREGEEKVKELKFDYMSEWAFLYIFYFLKVKL